MATGQDILDLMEILNQELQVQAGEADTARALKALNASQDYFESLLASRGKDIGGDSDTLVASAGSETTAFPTGVLRIDRLQVIDDVTGYPKAELYPARRTGGHATVSNWPLNLFSTSGAGLPAAYWTNKRLIYWSPRPSTATTVRWYGFKQASDLTAAGTFSYDDIVMLPLASFAARLLKMGVDDPIPDIAGLAQETFKATLDILTNFQRDGATGLEYTRVHTE